MADHVFQKLKLIFRTHSNRTEQQVENYMLQLRVSGLNNSMNDQKIQFYLLIYYRHDRVQWILLHLYHVSFGVASVQRLEL